MTEHEIVWRRECKNHYHVFLGFSCQACMLSCLPMHRSFPLSSLRFPNRIWEASGKFWSPALLNTLESQMFQHTSGIAVVVQFASCPPFTGPPEALLISPAKQAGLQHFWKLWIFFSLSGYSEIESVDLWITGNSYCWEKFVTYLKFCWWSPKSRRQFCLPSSLQRLGGPHWCLGLA